MNTIFKIKEIYILVFLAFISCSNKNTALLKTDFCASIKRNDSITLTNELADVSDLMKDKTGVYVLEDGSGSMIARAWLTEYAEKTIDIQYFIF